MVDLKSSEMQGQRDYITSNIMGVVLDHSIRQANGIVFTRDGQGLADEIRRLLYVVQAYTVEHGETP